MIRRLTLLVAAAALAVGAAAVPAYANDEMGLSTDGVTWTPSLTSPLYAAGFRWVPGDVEERSFRVRNDGPSSGGVTVDVVASDPAALLASPDFLLEARVGNGPWAELLAGTTRLQPAVLDVPRGVDTTVSVRGSFGPGATGHLDETASFEVRLTMSEDGDVAGVDDDGEVGGQADGVLPETGSAVGTGLLWLAAGMIGAGLALARPRRDRGRAVVAHD
ncbi:hypothetical protein RB608_24705 [Nocardioides sp. LHD-245]|uniref:hypothetical protein n=1 Tax=Nocardioides sp. LHD-245 TaxID=3051387 RepID=UPI0027DF8AEC|nr:hypothetical protein [Nocardioides sp. LHD-245]